MATIRPAKCYRWDSPAYTRTAKSPSNSYITGIPSSKLVHFDMGNPLGEYDTKAEIIYSSTIQIRHNALEATRILIQKNLEKTIGITNYYFKINVFPHHVMRENVTATGAGADCVSQGMRKAFGQPIGRAARVKEGQVILSIKFNGTDTKKSQIKKILHSASNKLPGEKRVSITALVKK